MIGSWRGQAVGVSLAFLAACGFPRPTDVEANAGPDAAADSDALGSRACFGSFVHICLEAAPSGPFTISTAAMIDTDSPLCATVTNGGANYCVIAATNITISAPLRATGTRPLVLIATESIVTTALIDVGSHFSPVPQIGAGADPHDCAVGTPPTGSGGSAGGSFVGAGGSGGVGGSGGAGGIASAVVSDVSELRGGCSGQNGDHASNGGQGGGAVFLIAGTRIDVRGGINAAGSRALGNDGGGGGGYGGGSGGMIGFEAPTITCNSLLLASGGGGGGGSAGVNSGGDGEDPMSTAAARGGGGANGGTGGNGSMLSRAAPGTAGSPGNPTGGGSIAGGGGGGGGGAGLIKAPATADLGTMVSPAATP